MSKGKLSIWKASCRDKSSRLASIKKTTPIAWFFISDKKRRSGDARKDDYYDLFMHNLKDLNDMGAERESKEVSLPEDPLEELNNLNGGLNILSFIIRVWREDTGMENPKETWRGHITSVPSGEREYFTDINQIPTLIEAHLSKGR